MKKIVMRGLVGLVLLTRLALADSTGFAPITTGFTLPDADQANSATSAQTANYANTAGSATSANSATYATNAGTASQAAGLTKDNSCPAGSALSATNGVLDCVSSVTSISGSLDGSQIVGNITNVGVVRTSGNIVAGGNLVSTGYVNGNGGLYSGNGVYATDYYGRSGGSNANFNGTASSATTASSANYAASTNVGILYQNGPGDGSTYYCGSGYYLKFYDTNVNSTNNAFFFECIRNGQ